MALSLMLQYLLSSARTSSVNAVIYYVFKVHVNITMALNSLLHYFVSQDQLR